jgi:hypothetical protein
MTMLDDLDRYRSESARATLSVLDCDHIDRQAAAAARLLSCRDAAVVVLEPGDATHYEVTLARRSTETAVLDNDRTSTMLVGGTGHDWFTVSLSTGGRPYPWCATHLPVEFYVREHFVHDDDYHTAVVLTEFLQRLHVHYLADTGVRDGAPWS